MENKESPPNMGVKPAIEVKQESQTTARQCKKKASTHRHAPRQVIPLAYNESHKILPTQHNAERTFLISAPRIPITYLGTTFLKLEHKQLQ
jgi:hypothetical protein